MNEIKGLKFFVEGDTKIPTRKKGDAGIDMYVPNLTEQFLKDLSEKNPGQPFRWGLVGAPSSEEEVKDNKGVYIYLPPHEDILIPTYVRALVPENVFLKVTNKSGVSTNQKFIHGADTIDSTYEGIIHIHVFNASNNQRFIEFGQKLVQLVPIIYDPSDIEIFYDEKNELFKEFKNQTNKDEFYKFHVSDRGDKGFGSGTGIK